MWFCCKPELTDKEKQRIFIESTRKSIEKGSLNRLKVLFATIDQFDCDLNVQVPVSRNHAAHWTRFIQIAVTKCLINHKSRDKYLKVIDYLLEHGAQFDAKDQFGHSVVDDIDKCPQVIRLFIKYGYAGVFTDLVEGMEEEKTAQKVKKNKVQPVIEKPLLAVK